MATIKEQAVKILALAKLVEDLSSRTRVISSNICSRYNSDKLGACDNIKEVVRTLDIENANKILTATNTAIQEILVEKEKLLDTFVISTKVE